LLRRVSWVWLPVLVIMVAQASIAAAWEIQVRHDAGYPARASEDGVWKETMFRSVFERVKYNPVGVHTSQMRSGAIETLHIPENKESVVIFGYVWIADELEPTEIARITVGKNDDNKCLIFRGSLDFPVFELC